LSHEQPVPLIIKGNVCFLIVAAVLVVSATTVNAQPAPTPCDGWLVEYVLSGSLELTDTPLGQGDGIYRVGPGSMSIRFDNVNDRPGARAKVISYEMGEAFQVVSKTLFWATTVRTDTLTRANPIRCGAPEGLLTGTALGWNRPLAGVQTDGTLFCEGSFCGKFGAPPPGQSGLHVPAQSVWFKAFQFGTDQKTFTMPSTWVSTTDSPKQTAHLALAGREVRRACVQVPSCP
jgi:hypothetical protein